MNFRMPKNRDSMFSAFLSAFLFFVATVYVLTFVLYVYFALKYNNVVEEKLTASNRSKRVTQAPSIDFSGGVMHKTCSIKRLTCKNMAGHEGVITEKAFYK